MLMVHASMKRVQNSRTKQIEDAFLKIIAKNRPDIEVEYIDLNNHKWGQIQPLNDKDTFDDISLAEYLHKVDVLVLSSPMYNFTISPLMKNFMDHAAIANVTFKYKYTTKNLEGTLTNRYINIVARGGFYEDVETAKKENIPLRKPYDTVLLDYVFGDYLGSKKIGEVVAEGLNVKGEDGQLLNPISKWIEKNEQHLIDLVNKI